jgi:YggT family protein
MIQDNFMGRPWWYDNYWEQGKKSPGSRFRVPNRKLWLWIALVILALLLAMSDTDFRPILLVWILGFIYYFCQILAFVILIRAILSWFMLGRNNIFIVLFDDITEPILSPLRKIIPRLGMFDITPIIAILILYFIPRLVSALIGLFV